jgi:DNA-binding PadR family transcriptional regulator
VTAPRSTTSYALLGLLALRSWTTYELAKQVQRSIGWFWPRAERKLYDEPKRLVEAGLAIAKREMTGARPRTVYVVTPAGRKALRRWLGEPPAPPTLEFEGMVKVFFADGGTLEQLQTTLRTIAEGADARLVELHAKAAENNRGDVAFPDRLHLNNIGLRFLVDHERATADWARWALDQTVQWTSATDPGGWDFRQVFPDHSPASDLASASPQ